MRFKAVVSSSFSKKTRCTFTSVDGEHIYGSGTTSPKSSYYSVHQ